ncbi:hypothetical protein C8R44DRAFT_625897 [Mycena epipterygia]|nr:hypothetical protein C8R44DRAFT_625897 [Mycena epipterygia]
MTHGFFISMGGFFSRAGHHPIITKKQLKNPDYALAIRQVEVEDISDKSKGDALSKDVALLQGLWFVMQCLARMRQHLPVTQLEFATLAFAVVNVIIWFLWWKKPLDVERPITVGPAEDLEEVKPTILPLNLWARFSGLVWGEYPDSNHRPMFSVPSFWSIDWEETNRADITTPFLIECLVGTIFGAIHCAAWTAHFPSTTEMGIWRSCSLMVAIPPAAVGLFIALGTSIEGTAIEGIHEPILVITAFISILLYPITRLFLIIISLTSLRALPHDALIDIDWSFYIPQL